MGLYPKHQSETKREAIRNIYIIARLGLTLVEIPEDVKHREQPENCQRRTKNTENGPTYRRRKDKPSA